MEIGIDSDDDGNNEIWAKAKTPIGIIAVLVAVVITFDLMNGGQLVSAITEILGA